MTGSLRSSARSPLAVVLMGFLMLVFLLLGIGGGGRLPDIFSAVSADSVVSAGGHAMSSRDFRRVFDNQKQKLEQQYQQQISMEDLIRQGVDQELLNAVADDEAEAEMLTRAGIDPGPALIDQEIKKLPFAFDKVTGKFSEQQFTEVLAQQGLTPRQAETMLGDQLAQRHFGAAVEAGFRTPRVYAALNAVLGLENRDVSYFILDAKTVPQPSAPTDAQLMAFMQEHSAQLMLPERRIVTLVRFSAKAMEPGVTVDPAAVAKEFDFKKDTLSTPEKRSLVQIPVKSPAEAAQAAAQLRSGEAPAAIAHAFGAEPVIYADAPQSAIADPKVAAAAFSLPAGAVSGPVQGELGMAVLRIDKVTPGAPATLESARPQIEAQLRTRQAQKEAYDLSQKFDDARQAGSNVVDAARKAGVTPITVGPIGADGLDVEGKPTTLMNPAMLKLAFAHAAGEETDLEDAGPGEYYALHVDKVIAPALPPLADKRDELAKVYIREQVLKALKARADALMAEVRAGASLDSVAAKAGTKVVRQSGMQRIQAQQYKAMGREFLQAVFGAKAGQVFDAGAPSGAYIARVDAIRSGDVGTMAQAIATIEGRVSQSYLEDLNVAVKQAARGQVSVRVNLALARTALGVDPGTTGPPAGAAGKAK